MNYRELVRKVNTDDYYFGYLNPIELKAQYNPERFHLWKALHTGPENEVLTMIYSPHYKYLNSKDDTYSILQTSFGRNKKWIKEKIKKFMETYQSIINNNFTENLVVMESPLVSNKYNTSYEIFEGHHRVAIALYLHFEKVPCQIVRNNL